MKQRAAKSMRQLADKMKDDHPGMQTHVHVRDAARQVDMGNMEGARRHLTAAVHEMTPQTLMRHGHLTDEHHSAAKQNMGLVNRHILMVRDIEDAQARNMANISRIRNNAAGTSIPSAAQPSSRMNAPAHIPAGPSDRAAEGPASPQPAGSRQFSTLMFGSSAGTAEIAGLVRSGAAPYRRDPDETVPCPSCGAWDAPDARFCDQCGVPLAQREPYRQFDAEDITCPFCGRGDAADAVFCDQCGKKLPETAYAALSNVELSARTAMLERTPAPRGRPGGPGLYDVPGMGHTPYFQQVVKALIEKRGMPPDRAYRVAWGALRRWRAGGGNVHPEVRAASAGALAGEAARGAAARAVHGHANDLLALELTGTAAGAAKDQRVPAGQRGGGQFGSGSGGSSQPAAKGGVSRAQRKAAIEQRIRGLRHQLATLVARYRMLSALSKSSTPRKSAAAAASARAARARRAAAKAATAKKTAVTPARAPSAATIAAAAAAKLPALRAQIAQIRAEIRRLQAQAAKL